MKTRKLLTAALLIPLCAGVTNANAAVKKKKPPPKPVCYLVTDKKGDATGTGLGTDGPNDPSLDLISADVATNATTLTAWIRLDAMSDPAMDTNSNDTSRTGRSFAFEFSARGSTQSVRGTIYAGQTAWLPNGATGSVDPKKKEVHISAPLSSFTPAVKPGDKLINLRATSWRYAGPVVSLGQTEQASSAKYYIAGTPSCVKVGT